MFKDLSFMQQHNLDPEFQLQPHPVLDILFTTIPECMKEYPGFTVASTTIQKGTIFGHIGFHDENEPTEKELYEETITRPPKANQLLFGGRSLSLGRVHTVGSILTIISTNADGSSGGCLVDDNVDVFAISFGSFYDNPEAEPSDTDKPPSDPLLLDLNIVEKGDAKTRAPRNRNIALSLSHPGVASCLAKILVEEKSRKRDREENPLEKQEEKPPEKKPKGKPT
eukprot:TRINITY_DN12138_c0_g1_i1.p1 TRINITY_DN12138_c0_g1~~TRINITY_DN12138_c0_g1_i1.p1  ORF type:complete len:225 (+),score=52.99 TRINITY_DN12138_c0_g1_i1:502-1176(+)